MKHVKLLSFTLAASMLAGVLPTAVFADSFSDEENTEAVPSIFTENQTTDSVSKDQENRPGTDVECGLTLHEKVDGVKTNIVEYNPSKESYDIQVGGVLDLTKVWNQYDLFKFMYTLKNGTAKFRAKNLEGKYDFKFQVNPDVVTVDQNKLCSTDAWQKAFEDGSQSPKAEAFFQYMRCSSVQYDEKSGIVNVEFTINHNGTKEVNIGFIEDNISEGSKPVQVSAYSPAGSFTIKKAKFQNDVVAVPDDETSFSGEIDMNPWMAMVFPIRFTTPALSHEELVLKGKPENTGGSGGSSSNKPVKNDYPLYRLYNPNSGEHFYTEAKVERDGLIKAGWNDEGIGWYSPKTSSYPVYRLYNPNAGDHHFTMIKQEKDELSKIGWKYEGISWYSLPANQGVKVYREYNPNAKMAGAHNYTTNKVENDYLVSIGWLDEGIAWWATKAGK